MTVYENRGQYDSSNVWFEDGKIRVYDKKNRIPEMHYIDYGLGVLRASTLNEWPRDGVVDLADIYGRLVAAGHLAGYEVKQRFYEIGSPNGLHELDVHLRGNVIG
jgi:NDP-sugar pyrophosphorylase family protein